MFRIDNTPPGTKRRLKQGAAARRGRTASTTAVGGAKNKEQLRQDRMKRERAANMAMVKKDNPMPKRPSADQVELLNKSRRSAEKTEKKLRSMGDELDLIKKTKKQLEKDYGTNTKKPAKKAKGGGMMKSKMKAKGYKAGGKMKTKGYKVGGPLKEAPEGNTGLKKLPERVRNQMGFMAKGGMMKTKGYAKGGAAGGKKKKKQQKVRGAGIARRGVRPAKMR